MVARQRHGPCSLLPRRLCLQARKAFHLPQQQTAPGLSVVEVSQENRVRASAIRKSRVELRRDPRRPREMGGAAAQLAHVAVLAAALGTEAGSAGLLRTRLIDG